MSLDAAQQEKYARSVSAVGPSLMQVMTGLEMAMRYMHPPAIPKLREAFGTVRERFEAARREFDAIEVPAELRAMHDQLALAIRAAATAGEMFAEEGEPEHATLRMLECMRQHAHAQEALYPLRVAIPPFGRFFTDESLHDRLEQLDPDPTDDLSTGLHTSREGRPGARGGFSLYVPETYDGSPLPLVVALHGGGGSGREFIWTWLREARSRRFLLLAPTAMGSTWSFNGPDVDDESLRSTIRYVSENWKVDAEHILLTGLSDGATYTLFHGLAEDAPYTALAPASGVLHPENLSNGNLARAAGRRIYLIHGRLDWMFPVQLAQMAHAELEKAGAEVVYREIEDLSHTYARDENPRILDWFLSSS